MRAILNYLGYVLELFSVFLIFPAIYALLIGESGSLFVIAIGISIVVGLFFRRIAKEIGFLSDRVFSFNSISLTQGFMIASLSFISLSAIAMVPYFGALEGPAHKVAVDAYFEAVSGVTTTGLSIIPDVSVLPKSLLLWRSLTQWIGGIGIVLVFLFIIYKLRSQTSDNSQRSRLNIGSSVRLYRSTISSNQEPNATKIMFKIMIIYGIFTALGILAYILAGLGVFDSVNIAFTAISTGGFIPVQEFSQATPVVIITMALMVLGAISFIAHDRLFRLDFKGFISDIEFRYLIGGLALFFILGLFIAPNLKVLAFQITSSLTTTGFSIWPVPLLHPALIAIIMLGMLIGGSTCSTGGGIKQFRLIIIIKSFFWKIKKMASPSTAVIPFKVNRKLIVSEETLLMMHILVMGFLLVALSGSLVFMYLGYSILDSFFQVISGLCTVGLSTVEIAAVPVLGKIVLIITMLLGRLEIFPLLVLIRIAMQKE